MASRHDLRDRYNDVMARAAAAAERSGRRADSVVVIAVTKNAAPDQVRQLLEFGHVDLGESRAQALAQRVAMTEEFIVRHRELPSPRKTAVPDKVRWHMIGHLQRNKVKQVIGQVKLIHSVDSLRLAEEVQAQAARQDREVDVLIQVNASGEKSKFGISPPAVPHLVDQMDTMLNVRVRGLMAMAPISDDPDDARLTFTRTKELFDEMRDAGRFGEWFNILSMGMSDDFETAIECGANVVRVGRALFGEPVEAAAEQVEAD